MVERSIFHGIFSRPSVIKLMEGCKNDFHGERYRVRLEHVCINEMRFQNGFNGCDKGRNTGNAEWRRANGRNKKRKLGINEKHD